MNNFFFIWIRLFFQIFEFHHDLSHRYPSKFTNFLFPNFFCHSNCSPPSHPKRFNLKLFYAPLSSYSLHLNFLIPHLHWMGILFESQSSCVVWKSSGQKPHQKRRNHIKKKKTCHQAFWKTHPPQLNTGNFKKIQVQLSIIYSLLPHSNASPNQNKITPQPPKLSQKGKKYFDSFDFWDQ